MNVREAMESVPRCILLFWRNTWLDRQGWLATNIEGIDLSMQTLFSNATDALESFLEFRPEPLAEENDIFQQVENREEPHWLWHVEWWKEPGFKNLGKDFRGWIAPLEAP